MQKQLYYKELVSCKANRRLKSKNKLELPDCAVIFVIAFIYQSMRTKTPVIVRFSIRCWYLLTLFNPLFLEPFKRVSYFRLQKH